MIQEDSMKATRQQVYAAIDTERLLQSLMIQAKDGSPVEHKPVESFALYINDYAAQLQMQLSRIWGPEAQTKALDTIRKIAALCVAAMEQHGAQPRRFPVFTKINGQTALIRPDMFDAVDPDPLPHVVSKRKPTPKPKKARKHK
jgi:hypothetical protein